MRWPSASAAVSWVFCTWSIILERLEREYNLDLITTAPNVVYKITKTDGTQRRLYRRSSIPDAVRLPEAAGALYAKANLIARPRRGGAISGFVPEPARRIQGYAVPRPHARVELHYSMPLNEIIYDFFDALKSRTRGYGSLDYELEAIAPSKLVKLDIS